MSSVLLRPGARRLCMRERRRESCRHSKMVHNRRISPSPATPRLQANAPMMTPALVREGRVPGSRAANSSTGTAYIALYTTWQVQEPAGASCTMTAATSSSSCSGAGSRSAGLSPAAASSSGPGGPGRSEGSAGGANSTSAARNPPPCTAAAAPQPACRNREHISRGVLA